ACCSRRAAKCRPVMDAAGQPVWSATSPKHTHPVTPLVKSARLVPGLLVFFFVFGGEGTTGVLGVLGSFGAILLLALLAGFSAWWSWRRTSYWFDEDGDLRVDSGIWQRNERRVQVSRLQSVDITQPLLARVFGLAQLRPEVAGASSGGTTLEYLELGQAQQLRAELLARAAGLQVATNQAAPEAPERILTRVPSPALAAAVILQPATLFAVVAVPLAAAIGFALGTWGVILPLLLVFVWPIVNAANQFLTWFDFTVAESPDGLRLRFGLTSHRSQTVPPGRVQAVRLESPLMWQPWGWARVTVNVAGSSSGEAAQERPSVVLPVAPLPVARAVLAQALPGVDPFTVQLEPAPPRARWRAPLQFGRLAAGANDQVFVSRHGWLVPKWDVVPHARTQSVRLTQGPWQRLLDLASVHVDSTPGPLRIEAAQRDAQQARRLLGEQANRATQARGTARPDRWLTGGASP
ncbi:MAG TPA: PH domain-containing protein, partial [Actinomycetes bacterium]|nr:PH domain-containing protein [Actinomycetes bacterium]